MNPEWQRQQEIQAKCWHPTGKWEAFGREALEQGVTDRFEQMADRYPERLALKMGDDLLTYRALNTMANRLARAILIQRGSGAELLALVFEQSVQAIVAMLAVWKAGKFFMALNPADPPTRLAQLVQEAGAVGIVTTRRQQEETPILTQLACTIVTIDECSPDLAVENLNLPHRATDLACIIYTSGSTGQPKGVVYNQRNVLYRAAQVSNLMHACAEDRTALLEYYSVSAALRDAFMTLLNGAALFLFDLKKNGAECFVQLLCQEAITLWAPMVTPFRTVVAALQTSELPHLRLVGIGGEIIHRQDIELYQQHFAPSCLLSLAFGASETVGSALRGWVDQQSELPNGAVSIGYPVAEVEFLLLDEVGHAVKPGEIGEIAVRSDYLAQGYWRQPELTAKVFWPDPEGGGRRIYFTGDLAVQRPDGQFAHLGRKDQQVKIRGHRVEIPEVEQALIALKRFSAVAVVARLSPLNEQRLIAYLVPGDNTLPTVTEIHQLLKKTLPDYMIPARFVYLDALPLTANGKVNRSALLYPTVTRPSLANAYRAPGTPVETLLAAIWCEVLGLELVGMDDNFLELGGNSLTAIQIIARVCSSCQVNLSIQQLFTAPTIATMAQTITEHQTNLANDAALEKLLNEVEALSEPEVAQILWASDKLHFDVLDRVG